MLPAGTSNRALNAHVDACLNPPKKQKREIKDWFQRAGTSDSSDADRCKRAKIKPTRSSDR
jgi:hypothetical protein